MCYANTIVILSIDYYTIVYAPRVGYYIYFFNNISTVIRARIYTFYDIDYYTFFYHSPPSLSLFLSILLDHDPSITIYRSRSLFPSKLLSLESMDHRL